MTSVSAVEAGAYQDRIQVGIPRRTLIAFLTVFVLLCGGLFATASTASAHDCNHTSHDHYHNGHYDWYHYHNHYHEHGFHFHTWHNHTHGDLYSVMVDPC